MFRKTILSQSVLIAFATAALGVAVAPTAFAQSNVVGSVYGQVAAGSGTQVLVENPATGSKRTVALGADGRFSLGGLAPGRYRASLLKDGKVVSTVDVDVVAAQGAEALFAGTSAAQKIEVVGRIARIDKTSSVSATVFSAKQLDSIPIATRDVTGIVALAANTTKADSRYAGGISIGGGGPSENAYYINGFPVTNALTQLGSIELPFGAIQQANVQTGGFGAEFGRSVGGVVSIITKSGTNEWHGGVGMSLEPDSLRSKPKSSYYGNIGTFPLTDGTIYIDRSGNTRDQRQFNANFGGAIIQDKLFVFVAADQTNLDTNAVNSTPQASSVTQTGWREAKNTNTRYLAKFDFVINEDHRLEATLFGDNYKTTEDYFGYSYANKAKTTYSYTQSSKNLANTTPGVGGDGQVLRYTGSITKDLQISALFGQSSSKHAQNYNFAPNAPQVLVNASTDKNPTLTYPTAFANPLPGGTTAIGPGAQEKTKSYRFDLEYQLGSHLLRAGLDDNQLKSFSAGDSYANVGGVYWRYFRTTNGSYSGSAGATNRKTLISLGAVPVDVAGTPNYYYARQRIFSDLTNADSNQTAQYIEDRWQATPDLLVTLGLRNEGFENKNGDGEVFLKMKSFVAPRANAAWDVFGDSSLKVFGSAGRFSLQIPTHIAVRGASRSTFTDQFFTYTTVDPVTGAPSGTLKAVSDPFSANNEYGQRKDPRAVSAVNMKPTYQDEITLGFEKALTRNINGGVKLTFRKLGATIDDFCDQDPIDAYATRNGIDATNYDGFGCATINAGQANTLQVDYGNNGKFVNVPLSAADIGLPKAQRTYLALDFFVEHPLADGWYGKLNYTYSKNKGNTEGQTKSDNAQTDVAATSTWDLPELMEGSYGYLPNDRTHQIKAFGYYQVTPEWGAGSTFVAESGRPKNCFGDYNGAGRKISYGAVYFYCGGVASPRGSQGRLPWSTSLDLNGVYKPAFAKGMQFQIDVFNLFNRQTAQVIDEAHDAVGTYGQAGNAAYGRVISYSAPRKVRLSAQYNF